MRSGHDQSWQSMLIALSGLGHASVMVFFALSSFLDCGSVHASMRKARFRFPESLVNRRASCLVAMAWV
jgi:hypothetical protein